MGAGPQGRGNIKRVEGCAAERCLRQKQPKRSRGSGLLFARAPRRPQQKQGTATRRDLIKNKITRAPPGAAAKGRSNKKGAQPGLERLGAGKQPWPGTGLLCGCIKVRRERMVPGQAAAGTFRSAGAAESIAQEKWEQSGHRAPPGRWRSHGGNARRLRRLICRRSWRCPG